MRSMLSIRLVFVPLSKLILDLSSNSELLCQVTKPPKGHLSSTATKVTLSCHSPHAFPYEQVDLTCGARFRSRGFGSAVLRWALSDRGRQCRRSTVIIMRCYVTEIINLLADLKTFERATDLFPLPLIFSLRFHINRISVFLSNFIKNKI